MACSNAPVTPPLPPTDPPPPEGNAYTASLRWWWNVRKLRSICVPGRRDLLWRWMAAARHGMQRAAACDAAAGSPGRSARGAAR